MASELPVSRFAVSQEEVRRLRGYIQQTDEIAGPIPDVRVARMADTPALTRLLEHPDVGPWIYTLPRPLNEASVRAFILEHLKEREEGIGVLLVAFDSDGQAAGYFDLQLWAEWSSCKFGGAVKPRRQGKGYGGATVLAAVDWCFNALGVNRICETTAPDNARSIRILSRIGFQMIGETISVRPDGTQRPSLIWELERSAWSTPNLRWRGARSPRTEANAPVEASNGQSVTENARSS